MSRKTRCRVGGTEASGGSRSRAGESAASGGSGRRQPWGRRAGAAGRPSCRPGISGATAGGGSALAITKAKQRVVALEGEQERAAERELAGELEAALAGLRRGRRKGGRDAAVAGADHEHQGGSDRSGDRAVAAGAADLRRHQQPAAVMLGALHAGLGKYMTLSGHASLTHHFQPLSATSYAEVLDEIRRLRGEREEAASRCSVTSTFGSGGRDL